MKPWSDAVLPVRRHELACRSWEKKNVVFDFYCQNWRPSIAPLHAVDERGVNDVGYTQALTARKRSRVQKSFTVILYCVLLSCAVFAVMLYSTFKLFADCLSKEASFFVAEENWQNKEAIFFLKKRTVHLGTVLHLHCHKLMIFYYSLL